MKPTLGSAEWDEAFENWTLDLEAIHDVGDRVIAVVRQRAKALHGGPEVEMRFAQIWTFRDGRATRMELYADPDEALEAAGLSE